MEGRCAPDHFGESGSARLVLNDFDPLNRY
jgi:hypothetical protein